MYNGDNPPPYDPDIINNQLIDTFGVTTAPEDYVFGSVNIQPRANYHSEHTFNTTDLTQQQIENAAILDEDGTIHELGINQEQNHEQGAIINDSALTILKWGKYNLRSIGLHQIATATNTNHWVIPAVMNVDIPLRSNQVLTNNGIYNVIQGQNGLEFQQTQQSRGLPDPTGTSIGQFNINVPTPKIKLKYIKNNNIIRNRTSIVNTGSSFSWVIGDSLVLITQDSTNYNISFLYASTTAYTQTVQQKTWVWKFTTNSNAVIFQNENSTNVFSMTNEQSDTNAPGLVIPKQFFDLSLLMN